MQHPHQLRPSHEVQTQLMFSPPYYFELWDGATPQLYYFALWKSPFIMIHFFALHSRFLVWYCMFPFLHADHKPRSISIPSCQKNQPQIDEVWSSIPCLTRRPNWTQTIKKKSSATTLSSIFRQHQRGLWSHLLAFSFQYLLCLFPGGLPPYVYLLCWKDHGQWNFVCYDFESHGNVLQDISRAVKKPRFPKNMKL